MVSLEPNDPIISSPRISFSAEFLDDENDFISISPSSGLEKGQKARIDSLERGRSEEFEFLSGKSNQKMLTADELFYEGKLLPFWQIHQHCEKLSKISIKSRDVEEDEASTRENRSVNWFGDDDPSPRPPKCTVLWKELLRLKKQRTSSSLSPSSSSSSSSSSGTLAKIVAQEEAKHGSGNAEKNVKKGLERTKSSSIRFRPMVNMPICTQVKSSSLPPLYPPRKGKLDR